MINSVHVFLQVHNPDPGAGICHNLQVVQVLDDGKSRAHCKAEDAGGHQESDTIAAQQVHQDQALDDFLDNGGQVAGECRDGYTG